VESSSSSEEHPPAQPDSRSHSTEETTFKDARDNDDRGPLREDIMERTRVEEELDQVLKLMETTDLRKPNDSRIPEDMHADKTTKTMAAQAGIAAAILQKGAVTPQAHKQNSVISSSNPVAIPGPGANNNTAAAGVQKKNPLSTAKTTSSNNLDRQNSAPQHTNAVAIYDYNHPDPNAKEFFSFKAGDVFTIIPSERDLQGWKIAISANNEKGFVPGNYLRYLPSTEISSTDQDHKKEINSSAQSTAAAPVASNNPLSPPQNNQNKAQKTPPGTANVSSQAKPEEKKLKTNKSKDYKKDKDKKEKKGLFGGASKKKT